MTTVHVDTPGGQYPIHIGPGRLDTLHESVPDTVTAIAIVTNPTVGALHLKRTRASLEKAGKPIIEIELPDGEAHKSWQTLQQVFNALLEHRFDRKCLLVALGGGVIGDITGFAAACYMRGVRFLQVPTTLLAQVDSSVGGKTGINHPLGKNMIGAFYQPIAVEIDTHVLHTLPEREITAGLAEVVKYGLIIDADFFNWCEGHVSALKALDDQAIIYAIQRSCECKACVVGEDEREAGLRAILNFGHTFAHAIEAGLGYGVWLHGEAVGCGMLQAAELSTHTAGLDTASVKRIHQLVHAIGCPVTPPNLGTERWIELMQVDKKTEGGQLRFVLLPQIGKAVVQSAPMNVLREVLQKTAVPAL